MTVLRTHSRAILAVAAAFLGACSQQPSQESSKTAEQPAVPSGPRAYISDETSGEMTIVDLTKMEPIQTIKLGKRPRGIHASPDHQFIYIALSGTPPAPPGVDESTLPPADKNADGIAVWDVKQNKVVRTLEGGSDPENFAVSQDGNTIFVSNEDASGLSFVDIPSGKVVKTIKTGDEPEGVTVTPDGKRVYVTSEDAGTLTVVDIAQAKVLKTFKIGHRPRTILFLADGLHGYCNAENDGDILYFDAVKNEKLSAIPLGKPGEIKPMGLAFSPDQKTLYVTTGRGHKVFVVDVATNKPTGSFEVGQRPWGIALTADGKTMITANGPSNDVSIIDVATQTIKKKVPAGGSPWGIQIIE